ncbi:T9SS-dependent choice-of-anchor J family protein [Algoriella sp.]|uniref:T9SS-dependent choice-of-anchor J family protein n=1 Tax=Algoriella sp. TaxID=1872434 RepID=UPI001B24A2F6|nr:T9SS type A sorting domain-containing protein [Algoriella sp.]MBO6212553.1 T9SS type A sorting domain-containing protein [Algoriella sp.]
MSALSTLSAQTVIWSDDFNDEDISDWTLIDADADGYKWFVAQIVDAGGSPSSVYPTPVLRSVSWSTKALKPDNYAITPKIDLSNYKQGDKITLMWKVSSADEDFDKEQYTVYASKANTQASMLASDVFFNEKSLDGVNVLTARTLDVSKFAGESSVYIGFRHHGVSDEFSLEIDDVSLVVGTLAVSEVNSKKISVYPNPVEADFKIDLPATAKNIKVEVVDLTGKKVASFDKADSYNISNLPKGVYILKVKGDSEFTQKIIKK